MGTYVSEEAKARRRVYLREWQRRYRRKHPDRVRAVEAKRDKVARAAARRERRAAGLEDYKSALKRAYQRRKDRSRAESRAWRKANPERWADLQRVSKAKRRAAIGKFTAKDIASLLIKQDGHCVGCGCDIILRYHVDHIIPLARGGSNWPENLQLLCASCNQSKGKRTMAEWAADRCPAP